MVGLIISIIEYIWLSEWFITAASAIGHLSEKPILAQYILYIDKGINYRHSDLEIVLSS